MSRLRKPKTPYRLKIPSALEAEIGPVMWAAWKLYLTQRGSKRLSYGEFWVACALGRDEMAKLSVMAVQRAKERGLGRDD